MAGALLLLGVAWQNALSGVGMYLRRGMGKKREKRGRPFGSFMEREGREGRRGKPWK